MQLKTSPTAEGPSSIPCQGTTKIPQAVGVTKKNMAQISLSYAKFTAFLENMRIRHYLRQLFVFFLKLTMLQAPVRYQACPEDTFI